MQQPVNMSGAPVTVSIQTASMQTRRKYIPVTSEPARQFKLLGVAHVVIGVLCIFLQLISIGCAYWVVVTSGNGLWIGTQFIVTGVFGIYAGRTGRKCQVITFHVLSTISAGCALVLLCTAAMAAVFAFPYPNSYSYWYNPLPQAIVGTVLEALIAILAIAEGIVAIRSSVIACTIGACCCKCRGSCCCPTDSQYQQLHNLDQTDLEQQQSCAISQQEPAFNTNQDQSVLNQHQPQLMFNPSQKQLVLNPNHQPPLFNPSQQQQMFILNQQQPMFNPSQQVPMFNPNQQQVMFLSTQPNIGFYPQHQAVQYCALQPITVPGSHQADASASLTGATGQGQYAGPLIALHGENTGTSGGNGSDKGPISSDDVDMLSP